jgi:hypothetical protein
MIYRFSVDVYERMVAAGVLDDPRVELIDGFLVRKMANNPPHVLTTMPVPLSYYSPLVGGLPGATRLGMEPTYYWDALQPEILEWLNVHSGPGQKVRFDLKLHPLKRLDPDPQGHDCSQGTNKQARNDRHAQPQSKFPT